jgi:hypothetical protein
MAGRDISVDRGALGTIRVMRTCGMMGEVVGKAASICVKENCNPRDVYQYHLDELKELMNLPGRARRATPNDTIDPNAPLPEVAQHPVPPRQGRGAKPEAKVGEGGIDPAKLPGIVIDDTKAKLTGNWSSGTGLPGFIGAHYLYDGGGAGNGEAAARFEFTVPAAGSYEVRFAYAAHANRATNVPVTVQSADGQKAITVNEQQAPKSNGFESLGVFRFDPAKPGAVSVSNKGTQGHVSVDAVQVVPAK